MLEKLGFQELVRYFFSGFVAAWGVAIAHKLTLAEALRWVRLNEWAAGFSPAVVATTILLLLGYFSYTVYRTAGYEWIALPIKEWLAKRRRLGLSFYSYRELMREILERDGITPSGYRMRVWELERIQRAIRDEVAPGFYAASAAGRVTAGLHLKYLSALIFLISFGYARSWLGVLGAALMYVFALACDAYFERAELLNYVAKRGELAKRLRDFKDNPAWLQP